MAASVAAPTAPFRLLLLVLLIAGLSRAQAGEGEEGGQPVTDADDAKTVSGKSVYSVDQNGNQLKSLQEYTDEQLGEAKCCKCDGDNGFYGFSPTGHCSLCRSKENIETKPPPEQCKTQAAIGEGQQSYATCSKSCCKTFFGEECERPATQKKNNRDFLKSFLSIAVIFLMLMVACSLCCAMQARSGEAPQALLPATFSRPAAGDITKAKSGTPGPGAARGPGAPLSAVLAQGMHASPPPRSAGTEGIELLATRV